MRHLLWLALFAGGVGYTTWPLPVRMGSEILGDAGDPVLNCAILEWNYATRFGWGDRQAYHNFPFSYPHDNVLAWSEHLFGFALMGWPVYALSGDAVLTYNVLILSVLVLNGWSMCLLAYGVTRRMWPSLLAGLTLCSGQYFAVQQGHIHCTAVFWGVLGLLSLHQWSRSWSIWRAAWAGFCAAMMALCGANLGAFFAVLFWPMALILFVRRGGANRAAAWSGLVVAAVPTAAAYLIFFGAYSPVQQDMGHRRVLSEIRAFSARPKNLSAPFESVGVWLGWQSGYSATGEAASLNVSAVPALMVVLCAGILMRRSLRRRAPPGKMFVGWVICFPISLVLSYNIRGGPGFYFVHAGEPYFLNWTGALASALALIGFGGSAVELMRRGRVGRPMGLYLWFTCLAVALSFGPQVRRHHHDVLLGPYSAVLQVVSSFDGIRVPSRFAAFVLVGLGMLTALGMFALRRKRALYYGVGVLAAAGLAAEWGRAPYRVARVPNVSDLALASDWIAGREPGAVLCHLPLAPAHDWRLARFDCRRILGTAGASARGGLRTVNGYSGYFSPLYDYVLSEWLGRWDDERIGEACSIGVRYLLVDGSLPGAESVGLEGLSGVSAVARFGEVEVFELPGADAPELVRAEEVWAKGARIVARGAWDSGRSAIELELGSAAAGTLVFTDRYLADLVLADEGGGRRVCGAAYMDTPFLMRGEKKLRATIRLGRLRPSLRSVEELDGRFYLEASRRVELPSANAGEH